MNQKEIPELAKEEIKSYVEDLQKTLGLGFTFKWNSLIRSFIKRIYIDYTTATVEYTIPINNDLIKQDKEVMLLGSLTLAKIGSAYRPFTAKL
jgi:hypothetical protein